MAEMILGGAVITNDEDKPMNARLLIVNTEIILPPDLTLDLRGWTPETGDLINNHIWTDGEPGRVGIHPWGHSLFAHGSSK